MFGEETSEFLNELYNLEIPARTDQVFMPNAVQLDQLSFAAVLFDDTVLDVEVKNIPHKITKHIFIDTHLSNSERFSTLVFMLNNGIPPAKVREFFAHGRYDHAAWRQIDWLLMKWDSGVWNYKSWMINKDFM